MPSSATITAFYSFTANTKARASYVNTNFSNYRGHIIAIDPNTATAATTETYDIGSTEYRWRTGYFRDIDIKANTSTGQALSIIGDTAAGQGAFLIKQGGNIRARIGGGNQYISSDTTTSQFDIMNTSNTLTTIGVSKWVSNIPTSTGQWDFMLSGSTQMSIKPGGVARTYLQTSPVYGVFINAASINTTTFALIATLSVTSLGMPTMVGMGIAYRQSGYLALYQSGTGSSVGYAQFVISRDSQTTSGSPAIFGDQYGCAPNATTTGNPQYLTISNFSFIDTSITAGSHTYYLFSRKTVSNFQYGDPSGGLIPIAFEAKELI